MSDQHSTEFQVKPFESGSGQVLRFLVQIPGSVLGLVPSLVLRQTLPGCREGLVQCCEIVWSVPVSASELCSGSSSARARF